MCGSDASQIWPHNFGLVYAVKNSAYLNFVEHGNMCIAAIERLSSAICIILMCTPHECRKQDPIGV